MIRIYKKCDKTINTPWGVEEITNFDSYDKPFLFCISPQESINKSVFGTIKEGARAARVRTSDEFAGGFKLSEMPIDFLGVKIDLNDKDNSFDLVNDFFYPFLKRGNDIKKQARKMNFFTYCNATNRYVQIEAKLKEKLLNDGYLENEVNDILSQISLISIASEIDISKVNATSMLFKDVNDIDVQDSISRVAIKKMTNLNRDTYTGYLRSNGPLLFAFNGSGEHNLKEYYKDDNLVKSSLCAVTSFLLDNSIKNVNSDELISISPRMILQMALKYNAEFENSDSLLNKLDDEITYNKTPKYSRNEELLLKELDISYLKLAKTTMLLARQEEELKKLKTDKQILISEVKDKCSDVAFHQIVVNNGMWNNTDDGIDYSAMKTDRIVREEYEKSIENNVKIR